MKIKATRKEIVNGSSDILSIGYCGASALLRGQEPIAYTCGIYGWNFDVYQIDGKTICTGYRNMPGRRPRNLDEYERRAAEIDAKYYELTYDERCEQINALLREFLAQA